MKSASLDPVLCHITSRLVEVKVEHRHAIFTFWDSVSSPRSIDGDKVRCLRERNPQWTHHSTRSCGSWDSMGCLQATGMPEIDVDIYPNTNSLSRTQLPSIFWQDTSPERMALIWRWVNNRNQVSECSKRVEKRKEQREGNENKSGKKHKSKKERNLKTEEE